MTLELLMALLCGHILGDYLFQNDWMALHKTRSGTRLFVHVCIYSICIAACVFSALASAPLFNAIYFLLWAGLWHAALDGGNLIERWYRLIGGRAYSRIANMPEFVSRKDAVENMARVSYTAIVQTVTDNSLHLVVLYSGARLWL